MVSQKIQINSQGALPKLLHLNGSVMISDKNLQSTCLFTLYSEDFKCGTVAQENFQVLCSAQTGGSNVFSFCF